MSASLKIDASSLLNVMEHYSQVTGKTIPDLVRRHARLCAVELANRTQPFAVKNKRAGKVAGETRVKHDIGKIIKTEVNLNDMFVTVYKPRIRERLQALANKGRWDVVEIVMRNIGFLNSWGDIQSVSALDPVHQENRNQRTGRTRRRAGKLYIATPKNLEKYVSQIQKRVGLSKAGWAECARQIGGIKGRATRGIPGWVTRQKKASGYAVDKSQSRSNPRFLMTNTVPWIDRICPESEQRKSLNIARDKMIKSMMRAMREAAKQKADLAAVVDSST